MDHINKKIKIENDFCANPERNYIYINDDNKYAYQNSMSSEMEDINRTHRQNHIFEQIYLQPSSSERHNQDHLQLENFLIENEKLILNRRINEYSHEGDRILIEDSSSKINYIADNSIVANDSVLSNIETIKSDYCLENRGSQYHLLSESQSTTDFVNSTNISEKDLIVCSTSPMDSIFMEMEQKFCQDLLKINYYTGGSKITHVYNPIDYAEEIHRDFLNKFCHRGQKVLLLGMNPGPWGMGQTGVPFGHVDYARDWLQVRGEVRKPLREHPKRPVIGLSSLRKEVSGNRLWSLLKELSGTPEALFKQVYLHNYCPLFFMTETGKNVTPPELKAQMRRMLETICDRGLVEALNLLETQHIVAVGNYAASRAQRTIKEYNITNITVSTLMHPSPINPAANKGWREIALKQLAQANVLQYFKHSSCIDGVP